MCSAQEHHHWALGSGGMKRPYPTTFPGSRIDHATPLCCVEVDGAPDQLLPDRRWFPVWHGDDTRQAGRQSRWCDVVWRGRVAVGVCSVQCARRARE